MSRRPYTKDSLYRALIHHVSSRRLDTFNYSPNVDPRHPWLVQGFNEEATRFTNAQCAALCYGLASAQYGEDRRQMDDLKGWAEVVTGYENVIKSYEATD